LWHVKWPFNENCAEFFRVFKSGIIRSNPLASCAIRPPNRLTGRIWFAVPEPTEWQRVANQLDATMIFAGAHFVKRAGIVDDMFSTVRTSANQKRF